MGKDRLMDFDDNGYMRDAVEQMISTFKTTMPAGKLKVGTPVIFQGKPIGVVTGSNLNALTGTMEVDVSIKAPIDPLDYISISVNVENDVATSMGITVPPTVPAPLTLPQVQGFRNLIAEKQQVLAQMLLDVTVDPFALREV
jgi:hypothetical protein